MSLLLRLSLSGIVGCLSVFLAKFNVNFREISDEFGIIRNCEMIMNNFVNFHEPSE